MRYLLPILFLVNCSAWQPTRNAVLRSRETHRLKTCLAIPGNPVWCIHESDSRCLEQGLEPGCGVDGLW